MIFPHLFWVLFVHYINSSDLHTNQLKQIEEMNPSEVNCHDFSIAYDPTQTLDRPTHVPNITVSYTILLSLDCYRILTILSALFKNRSLRTEPPPVLKRFFYTAFRTPPHNHARAYRKMSRVVMHSQSKPKLETKDLVPTFS